MEISNILSVNNLNISFNDHEILNNLSFDIARDTTVAVIGPNGSGKTVLFKCLLNLIQYNGDIKWSDDVRIGYVPQKLALSKDLPLTVLEFLGLKESKMSKIMETLCCVGFKEEQTGHIHNDTRVLKTRLSSLSGGELQRVLMANALLGDPNVLLLDEPTAGVDIEGEETFYSLFKDLKKDKDLTIIFISHDPEVVKEYADITIQLKADKIIELKHDH